MTTNSAFYKQQGPMRTILTLLLIHLLVMTAVATNNPPQKPAWPAHVTEIAITSSADNSPQPAMYYAPAGDQPVPLLVSLHTWSGGYTQLAAGRANWCLANQWAFIHPHFRGPNRRPEAMGSELAVRDILDAVDYAKQHAKIDASRIYLLGFSGGGHAALLMAGRAPAVWAGVSAWCGISDLKKWHAQSPGYGRGIAAAAGGDPQQDAAAAAECARRSPSTWLEHARGIPVDIAAGIHDGHTGSVPVSQSLEAFNLLARPADRLSAEEIASITKEQLIPDHLRPENGGGMLLQKVRIHFQRQSGNARVTLFEGGHQGLDAVALPWLARQRQGAPAVWDAGTPSASTATNDADFTATGK